MTWGRFVEQAPELASFGAVRLNDNIAYLATVKKDGSPRVHPVRPFVGQGHLFIFIDHTSPKGYDLRRDGRYALHCSVQYTNGLSGEFLIMGEAELISDPRVRQRASNLAGSAVPERYLLFEFLVSSVLVTEYDLKREPIRRRWKRGQAT